MGTRQNRRLNRNTNWTVKCGEWWMVLSYRTLSNERVTTQFNESSKRLTSGNTNCDWRITYTSKQTEQSNVLRWELSVIVTFRPSSCMVNKYRITNNKNKLLIAYECPIINSREKCCGLYYSWRRPGSSRVNWAYKHVSVNNGLGQIKIRTAWSIRFKQI